MAANVDEFTFPNSEADALNLRTTCAARLAKYNIRCISSVKLLLYKHHNQLSFDNGLYSLRLLKENATLVFTDNVKKIQVSVCWFQGCTSPSGTNSLMLCSAHRIEYQQIVDLTESEFDDMDFKTGNMVKVKSKEVYRVDTLSQLRGKDARHRKNIADMLLAFVSILYDGDMKGFNAYAPIPPEIRLDLSNLCKGKIIQLHDTQLTFDAKSNAFLIRALKEDSNLWTPICNEKQCLSLSIDSSPKCTSHFLSSDGWKEAVLERLLKLAGVERLSAISRNSQLKLMEKITQAKQIKLFPNTTVAISSQSDIRICHNGTYFNLCTNFAQECGNLIHSKYIPNGCGKCFYGRVYTAYLLRLEDVGGGVFLAIPVSHVDPQYRAVTMDVRIRQAIGASYEDIAASKYTIIAETLCRGGMEEAIAYCNAYWFYAKLECMIFEKQVRFRNVAPHFNKGVWKAIANLGRKYGILIKPADAEESRFKELPNYGYKFVERDFYNMLDSQDYTPTIYKIVVDHLIYIGVYIVESRKGRPKAMCARKHLRVDLDNTKCRRLLELLKEKGFDFKKEPLPATIILEIFDETLSHFVPETILILAFSALETVFEFEYQVINSKLSSVLLRDSWFEELQYAVFHLSGKTKTLDLVKADNLSIETSLLFSQNL